MALLNLVYRDQLFPREAYRQTFDLLLERLPERQACRIMVELLALAHERGCESELADLLAADLERRAICPTSAALRIRFAPDPAPLPNVVVQLAPLAAYEALHRCRPDGRRGMSTAQHRSTPPGSVCLLNELRLPAIKVLWPQFAEQADKEGWPAARFLAAIAEHELAERDRRRIERHLVEARLPARKDPRQLRLRGRADDLQGASHGDRRRRRLAGQRRKFAPVRAAWRRQEPLASAIGLALIENGWRVLFTRTTDLVQKLQVARRELDLEAAINRLDRFDLLILDDLAYVTKDQAETSVLFELISARYERRSMLITANQPFGEWGKVFPDPAMTLAAIDRLVHHATIFEMNVESYRRPRPSNENVVQDDRRVARHTRQNRR